MNLIRYELKFGNESLSFSAMPAKTNKELASILEDVVLMLRADSIPYNDETKEEFIPESILEQMNSVSIEEKD